MSALIFLVRKQIKNFFLELIHHPSKLIVYLFTIGIVVMMMVSIQLDPPKRTSYSDFRMLHGIFLAWLLFLSVPVFLSALKSGTTVFKMSDVNYLFVSPISPKRILAYGLTKQMLATLLSFVFLLCYSGMLMEHFRITAFGVVMLVVGSAVLLTIMQILSLLVYSFANGDPKRQNMIRAVFYAIIGAMVLTALYIFQKNGGGVEAIYAAISSPILEYFPIVGWTKGVVFALITGNAQAAVIYGTLLAVAFILCFVLFERSDSDFYEDVLQNTETQYEAKLAVKEKRSMTMRSTKKIKVGRTGLDHGWGANAFFFKHLCEARRRSRLIFISLSTVLTLAADVVLMFVIQSSSRGDKNAPTSDILLLIAFAANIYILFFLNAAGDWSRELGKPYVYLVPEDPFKKLIWASMTSILKPLVDGAVIFIIACVAVRANLLTGFICFLAYASFGLLFTSGNILAQRTMGGMGNRGLIAILYMMMLMLLIAPGVGTSIAVYFTAAQNLPDATRMFLAGLPTFGWNVLVSTVILFACRNLLSTAEMDT